MNFENILYGLIAFLGGLIGIVWNSQRSAMDKKNTGWTYSLTKFIVASWGLVITGIILIILGLFNIE